VHNCPESKNVQDEIETVEHSAAAAIKAVKGTSAAKILAREFGSKQFERLYKASGSPILVTATTKISVPAGFSINGGDWSAYQTFVPGALVYKLFKTHGADLFSANVRDYLGSR